MRCAHDDAAAFTETLLVWSVTHPTFADDFHTLAPVACGPDCTQNTHGLLGGLSTMGGGHFAIDKLVKIARNYGVWWWNANARVAFLL